MAYNRNNIDELRAVLFEIGSIQKSEESCETINVPAIGCDTDGATEIPSLRKAHEIGKKKLQVMVFPLFSTHGREVWSCVMFLFTLGLAIRSALNIAGIIVAETNIDAVDYVDFGLSIATWVLAFLDLAIIICLQRCRLARDACNTCKRADDPEMQHFLAQETAADEGHCCSSMLHRCADIFRMALFDILVYSITICSMFKAVLWETLQDTNDDSAKKYIIYTRNKLIIIFSCQTLLSMIVIYGIRIFVIARILFRLQKARKNGPMEKSGRWFHIRFFFHMLGQMVSQVVIVVFIGIQFYFENTKNDYSAESDSTSIAATFKVSLLLWFMIVGGLVIPFFGVFTFIIGNYISFKEYPIEFFFDLLLTSERNAQNEESLSFKSIHLGMSSEEKQIAKTIAQKCLRNFEIYQANCFLKYLHIFVKPVVILLSIPYTFLFLAFIICSVLGLANLNQVSNSSGWVAFIVLGIIQICLANIRVLLVGGVWLIFIKCLFCFIRKRIIRCY